MTRRGLFQLVFGGILSRWFPVWTKKVDVSENYILPDMADQIALLEPENKPFHQLIAGLKKVENPMEMAKWMEKDLYPLEKPLRFVEIIEKKDDETRTISATPRELLESMVPETVDPTLEED